MANTDPVADMLSRIRNAILVQQDRTSMPYSSLKERIAKELKNAQFIHGVEVDGEGAAKTLTIVINEAGTNPKISVIEKVSKPGRRIYAKAGDIPTVKNGRGVVILSTSQGIMSGFDAKARNVGGEMICKVY